MSYSLKELKERKKKLDYRPEDLSEVFFKALMEFNAFAKKNIKKIKQSRKIHRIRRIRVFAD